MKYTLNETSFQPSLSANIQIYQIFEKKGKSLPDFLCSPTSTGRKTTRKLDKISTPLRSSRKKRKRRGRLSSTAADEYPFSNAAEVHQFFFFLSSSLWATWWSCVQPLEEFTAVGESLVLRFSFQRWSWKYHAEGTNKLVKSRCVVIFPTLLMLYLVLWIRLNCDLFLFILLWIKKLIKKQIFSFDIIEFYFR